GAIALGGSGYVPNSVIRIEVTASLRVSVTRTFLSTDVAAIFIPDNPACVEYGKGKFLLRPEIDSCWDGLAPAGDGAVLGIVYVPENAPVLTEVQMGMTAAQSIDYVPPLGTDRSVDHYALDEGERFGPKCPGVEHSLMRMVRPAFCDP
ncbi:MAG TPA: hypothetical protein PK867_20890, partial [Pirellulales bacterium]|nr:hypothetical protein [Pirellulales bacterium]